MFAYDFDGHVILIGNDAAVQGQDRFGMLDMAGKPFIQELLAAARAGGGTVSYRYPRGPAQPSVPKLAYVRPFKPWNIFIGTGVYIDDVEAAFAAYLRAIGLALTGALLAAAALAFWIGRYVTASLTERRAAEARIVHLAHHDTLTDLPNRALLQERLAQAVRRAVLDPSVGAGLLLCDLDRFKEVNDTFGHPTGDELLRQAAQRMRACMRKVDTLARLGGDEFAIILLECRHKREAELVAVRIVDAISRPFDVYQHTVSVGVSIGIALAPADARDPVDLMKRADTALYVSKRRGRGMATPYSAAMSDGLHERHTLEADLRRALGANEFEPYFQPMVDLQTGRIVGFEALTYWLHPTRGVIGPDGFAGVAEQCGLMVPLGERILRVACLEAVSWDPGVRLAVNLSSQLVQSPRFLDVIRSALIDTGLAAERLELEVTETTMLSGGERMRSVLDEVRACGPRLSLAAFGTGQSSLTCIQRFPINKIRIDGSIIGALGTDAEAEVIGTHRGQPRRHPGHRYSRGRHCDTGAGRPCAGGAVRRSAGRVLRPARGCRGDRGCHRPAERGRRIRPALPAGAAAAAARHADMQSHVARRRIERAMIRLRCRAGPASGCPCMTACAAVRGRRDGRNGVGWQRDGRDLACPGF